MSGGVGNAGGLRLASIASNWFWIRRCLFSSFSFANLASGDESMMFSRFCCSLVSVGGFSIVWVNCVSNTFHACCSLTVSMKSSSYSRVFGCCRCAVLVKSRYFSTLLSSF